MSEPDKPKRSPLILIIAMIQAIAPALVAVGSLRVSPDWQPGAGAAGWPQVKAVAGPPFEPV